jgi:hypothetical protein
MYVDAEHDHKTFGIKHSHPHEHLDNVTCDQMRYHKHHANVMDTINGVLKSPVHPPTDNRVIVGELTQQLDDIATRVRDIKFALLAIK